MDKLDQKMRELMVPIDESLVLCANEQEMLMLACVMLQRTREIFDYLLGQEGRMQMFKDYADKADSPKALH